MPLNTSLFTILCHKLGQVIVIIVNSTSSNFIHKLETPVPLPSCFVHPRIRIPRLISIIRPFLSQIKMAKVFDYGKNRLAECLRENFVVPFYNYDGRGRPISRMKHDSFRLKLPGNYRPLSTRDHASGISRSLAKLAPKFPSSLFRLLTPRFQV